MFGVSSALSLPLDVYLTRIGQQNINGVALESFLIDDVPNGYTLIPNIHELKPWVFFAFKVWVLTEAN